MKSKWFNPEKNLLTLPILWVTVSIIILTSLTLGFIIYLNTPLIKDLSANGFNNFVKIFSVPLGVLALIIPIVGLLAANHRSSQTSRAITTSNSQNNFSNYYKHLEEFKKHCNELKTKEDLHFGFKEIKEIDSRIIHKILYPDAKDKGIIIPTIQQIKLLQTILEIYHYIITMNIYNGLHLMSLPVKFIRANNEHLDIFLKHIKYVDLEAHKTRMHVVDHDIYILDGYYFNYAKEMISKIKLLYEIFCFDESFDFSRSGKNALYNLEIKIAKNIHKVSYNKNERFVWDDNTKIVKSEEMVTKEYDFKRKELHDIKIEIEKLQQLNP